MNLSYVAGFFDADGCVTIGHHRSGIPHVIVDISQKYPGILDLIWEVVPGGRIRQDTNGYWRLVWYGRDGLEFLKLIAPYLVIKQKRAELAIKLIDRPSSQGKKLSATELEERWAIANEIKRLIKEELLV